MSTENSFNARDILETDAGTYYYYRLMKLADDGIAHLDRMPRTQKIFLESALRSENGVEVTAQDVRTIASYDAQNPQAVIIPFSPARVLMQDFTGVPALVDLAALRSAMARFGKDPQKINPQIPVDLVIDHSVQVDVYNSPEALQTNSDFEFQRNSARYEFLHWGQKAFQNFRCVPPAMGICHQVNLESLGRVTFTRAEEGLEHELAYPDTLVGCDSHTTMINGLGILGWGVGGIEAEAVILGQPYFMVMPEIVGFKLTGALPEGVTATDLVLTITQLLRRKGVVGKIVEFFGAGLSNIGLADRATIANMSPEMGARACYFPVDRETLRYMRNTGRSDGLVALTEAYCKAQGLFRTDDGPEPVFKDVFELDISTVVSSLAGPKRPQDKVALADMKTEFSADLRRPIAERGFALGDDDTTTSAAVAYPDGTAGELKHGDVVIAAITSCTNTSNPYVLIGAGLLAKKAVEKGLTRKPHVKTSLAPGSRVVTYYLDQAGLTPYLEKLGFHTVGYGCTTCIGNSGPLDPHIVDAIEKGDLVAAAVLSGNRNFEGRINPHTQANYLASPILCVAYAIAGTVLTDLTSEPIGVDSEGRDVFLRDIWPSKAEIEEHIAKAQEPESYRKVYGEIYDANEIWNGIPSTDEPVYPWSDESTYIQEPPFFVDMKLETVPIEPIIGARCLVKVGDSVTTDHISPAGAIPADMPAGRYLIERGVEVKDFNSFGSRRGNDRVMTRGTFGNIRMRNQMAPDTEGGWTTHLLSGEVMTIYDAAMKYQADGVPLVVLAGKDYGMGSSRDWAAKGTKLLGGKAVIAVSFEIIHRANLVGMGVLPLQFKPGESADALGLTGRETFTIHVDDNLTAGQDVVVDYQREDGSTGSFHTTCRIDSPVEVEYYRHGGVLDMALRRMIGE
ncbi:MAG: aconitate hydratase AcnA [Candidatus Lernaella stagnicola]|nr:aconitate hydratase AcnA [Candidatus Lernaella stagnicola]